APRAGLAEVVEGAITVARLDLDGPGRVGDHLGVEPHLHRVEAGLLHAVVGGEAGDDHMADAAVAQVLLEARLAALACRQVRPAEPRIPVLRTRRLLDGS